VGVGVGEVFLGQSGQSIVMRGEGVLHESVSTKDFLSHTYFTLWKLKKPRKFTSVQKSEDYRTLIEILLGEITFVIGPDCSFVYL
jgi:hypothetical protein